MSEKELFRQQHEADKALCAKLWRECDYTTDEDVCILVLAKEIEELGGSASHYPRDGDSVWVPVTKVREFIYRMGRHRMHDFLYLNDA